MSESVNQGGLQGIPERPGENGRSRTGSTMLTHHLSYSEFRQVARLCRSIDLGRLPTGFDLKRYLLRLLIAGDRSTANAVDRLTDEQVNLLHQELAEFQALVV